MKKLKETLGLVLFVLVILAVFVLGIRHEMANERVPIIKIPPCLDTV